MNKSCENCALFNPNNDKEGKCDFWLIIVPKNDYCVEYKEKKE